MILIVVKVLRKNQLEKTIFIIKMGTCNKLKKVYNAGVLDHVSKLEQKLFYLNASKNLPYQDKKIATGANTTLIQLINNRYTKKGPMPDFIGGPKNLSLYWNPTYEMTIYIFGETHTTFTDCNLLLGKKDSQQKCDKNKIPNPRTGQCVLRNSVKGHQLVKDEKQTQMNIEEFLKLQVASTPAFIDIYVELPLKYIPKEGRDHVDPKLRLAQIALSLRKCSTTSERKHRDCDLFRLHLIDVRKMKTNANLLSKFRLLIHKELEYSVEKGSLIRYWLGFEDHIFTQTIKKLNQSLPECIKFIQTQITSNFYAKKELSKSFLHEQIVSFLNIEIEVEVAKIWRDMNEFSTAILTQPLPDDELIWYTIKIINYTTQLNIYSVDAYTLARIFKRFNVKKSKVPGQLTNIDQPILPHNSIIYTGDGHAHVYRKFLHSIGSELKAFVGNSVFDNPVKVKEGVPKNCIDMRSFPLPLFNTFPI
jgi:hypothetical protein